MESGRPKIKYTSSHIELCLRSSTNDVGSRARHVCSLNTCAAFFTGFCRVLVTEENMHYNETNQQPPPLLLPKHEQPFFLEFDHVKSPHHYHSASYGIYRIYLYSYSIRFSKLSYQQEILSIYITIECIFINKILGMQRDMYTCMLCGHRFTARLTLEQLRMSSHKRAK